MRFEPGTFRMAIQSDNHYANVELFLPNFNMFVNINFAMY